jgi:hypothetical protein
MNRDVSEQFSHIDGAIAVPHPAATTSDDAAVSLTSMQRGATKSGVPRTAEQPIRALTAR